jgi:hypothetical protein
LMTTWWSRLAGCVIWRPRRQPISVVPILVVMVRVW